MKRITRTIFLWAVLVMAMAPALAQKPGDSVEVVNLNRREINIGFARQDARFTTSAVSTIKGAELRPAFTNNISNTLYGRLAGLFVNQAGNEPGANNATLYVRGQSTYGFSTTPLIVIDGFLADYTQLVPQEIEEISLLKDAAATAIYGLRGANGVLLVTTKKGRSTPLAVSFEAQYGVQEPTALPKYLDAFNYASLYNEALVNDGRPALYSQADLDAYRHGSDPLFHPNVDWYSEVLRRRAPFGNYNLNFSGGNNSVKYFVLLNALTSQGLFKNFGNDIAESSNAGYSRYNFRANVDVSLSKVLSAQLILGGSVEEKKNPADLYANNTLNLLDQLAPNAFPVRNPDGSYGGSSAFANPLGNLESSGFSTFSGRTIQSSFRLSQDWSILTPGLTSSVAVSFNNYYVGESSKRKTYQRFAASKNAGDTVYTAFGQKTSLVAAETINNQWRNYAVQAQVAYDRTFGANGFNALLLFNADNYNINRNLPNTNAANQGLPYKTNGGGARLTYVRSEKYIAEFTAGYQGAENFPTHNRYGFFPAGSLGWILSNERFLDNNKTINFLKLRGSYGLTGNENIGGQRFSFIQQYPFGASYYFGTSNTSVGSYVEGRRANTGVTWEKETKANIGIEARLFNHLSLVADYFSGNRYDILSSSAGTIPQYLGYTLPDVNIGEVNNKGFEVTLGYENATTNAFRFSSQAIVSHAKNIINYNGEVLQINPNLYRTGTSIDQPFGLRALGLFQSDAEAQAGPSPLGVEVRAGDVKYQDIGGPNGVPDGIIDGNDVQAIGYSALPQWTAGWHTAASYKGFDIDLNIQAVTNVSQYLGGSRYNAFVNNGKVGEAWLDRWTPQNTGAAYPRLSIDNQNNYRFSSFWQRDGSFIKLRSAEVGYTVQPQVLKRFHLTAARFFVSGTNLFSLDHIEHGDPEALYGYPSLRTYSVGLRLHL